MISISHVSKKTLSARTCPLICRQQMKQLHYAHIPIGNVYKDVTPTIPTVEHSQLEHLPQEFSDGLTTSYFTTFKKEILSLEPLYERTGLKMREIEYTIDLQEVNQDNECHYQILLSHTSKLNTLPITFDFFKRTTRLFLSQLSPELRSKACSSNYELLWNLRHYHFPKHQALHTISPHIDTPIEFLQAAYPPLLNSNVEQSFYFLDYMGKTKTAIYSTTNAPIIFGPYLHSIDFTKRDQSKSMQRCVVNVGLRNMNTYWSQFI
ncbi:hypothetical protein DID76_02310 [Candidatus Marinamargulisbacteria bacterium SCGC AG-414-C22]|nr:hypothetical protein DID76_02310 [Candidatus Marinamargulisbacteria bacterium SCGC AG-414-C22]